MVYLKACPKCMGDLAVGRDMYGSYVSCLQCGFMRDLEIAAKSEAPSPARDGAAPEYAAERLPLAA